MRAFAIDLADDPSRFEARCQLVYRSVKRWVYRCGCSQRARIAILGEDALKPTMLLEAARAALAEARRQGPRALQLYSNTVRKLPKMRLDLERELRQAIASNQIELHYLGRHNLASGQLEAVQA